MPIFDDLIRRESPFYVLGAKPPVVTDLRSLIPAMDGTPTPGYGLPAIAPGQAAMPPMYDDATEGFRNRVTMQHGRNDRTAPPAPPDELTTAGQVRNIVSAFDNIRSGTAGPAPAMIAVTSNPRLLAEDARADRVRGILQKLRSTGTGSPAQAANYQEQMLAEAGSTSPLGYSTNIRPPVDPPAPSESGRTGKRGSAGYQTDRNLRLAIVNEQERNRQPSPAEFTLNENNLPAELAKVYADRKSLKDKRVALAEQFPLNIPAPAYNDQAKAAMAKQYTDRGLAVPGVYSPIASPEKVAADKAARAADEKRRFDNWSMREQTAGIANKLGINPLIAAGLVMDRIGTGPNGVGNDIMQAAIFGPQAVASMRNTQAYTDAQRYNADRGLDRQRLANEGQLANTQEYGKNQLGTIAAQGDQARQAAQMNQEFQLMLTKLNNEQALALRAGDRQHASDLEDRKLAAQIKFEEFKRRYELTPQQQRQDAAAGAMLQSDDPLLRRQGAELLMQGGAIPSFNMNAPMPSPTADATAYSEFKSGTLGPMSSKVIADEFGKGNLNTNMSLGLDSLYWNPARTAAHQTAMIEKLSREYAIAPEVIEKMIDQWYATQYQGHTGLFSPHPSDLPAQRQRNADFGYTQPY